METCTPIPPAGLSGMLLSWYSSLRSTMAYDHTRIENVLNEVALALWGRSRFEALAQGTCTRCGKRIGFYRPFTPRLRQCLDLGLCLVCLRELEANNV